MYVNEKDKELDPHSQFNVIHYNFNYDLKNKHITELTHFWQCHQIWKLKTLYS